MCCDLTVSNNNTYTACNILTDGLSKRLKGSQALGQESVRSESQCFLFKTTETPLKLKLYFLMEHKGMKSDQKGT